MYVVVCPFFKTVYGPFSDEETAIQYGKANFPNFGYYVRNVLEPHTEA